MDDQGPDKPEGPVVAVFRSGKSGPERTSAAPPERTSAVPSVSFAPPPPSTPPSEPPALAVVKEALTLDLSQKLLGVDELYALLDSATHYRLLSVSASASPAQIREAYFTSVRCFHPYTFVLSATDERRVKVSAVFEALTRAYETLRRPTTRASYDDAIGLPSDERFGTTPVVAVSSEAVPVAPAPVEPEPSAMRSVRPPAPQPRASARPPAPRTTSLRMGAAPSRSLKPSMGARPMMMESLGPSSAQRERASAAARAERDFVVDDGTSSGRSSNTPGQRNSFGPEAGSGGARNPFDNEGSLEEAVRRSSTLLRELDKVAQERLREEEPCPSILEIANQVRGGGTMSNWAAGRLRDAHNAEQSGQLRDAASILKSVHNQLRDPHVQAHAQRIARMIIEKG